MGKNPLVTRIVSGALFGLLMIVSFFFPAAYLIVFSAVITAASIEFSALTDNSSRLKKERFCVLWAELSLFVLVFCVRYCGMPYGFVALGFLPLAAAMILMLFDCSSDCSFSSDIFFPVIYVALPVISTLWLTVRGAGTFTGRYLLAVFAMIWFNDIGAYAFGMALGQRKNSRKLFPALSPKKSWVGVFGGILMTVATAFLVKALIWKNAAVVHLIILAVIISASCVLGDLFESLIKRHAGVKDSGNLIPGHGGALDRFDAALFALPAATLYACLANML